MRSAEALAVTNYNTQSIQPYLPLSEQEKEIWDLTVSSWAGDYFMDSDVPLLTVYCKQVVRMVELTSDPNYDTRTIIALGRSISQLTDKLRISPLSRTPKDVSIIASRAVNKETEDDEQFLG